MQLVETLIKMLRSKDPSLTDYRIAKDLGVPQSALQMLRDRTKNPRLDTLMSLYRLAKARLGMTPDQFLELCDKHDRALVKKRLGAR